MSLAITTVLSVRCSVSMALQSTRTVARSANVILHRAIYVRTGIISPARMTQRVSLDINVERSLMGASRAIACATRRLVKLGSAPVTACKDLVSVSLAHPADVTNPIRVT